MGHLQLRCQADDQKLANGNDLAYHDRDAYRFSKLECN